MMDQGDWQKSAESVEDLNELQNEFECATEFMKTVAGNLDKNRLLYFYARFKQVT